MFKLVIQDDEGKTTIVPLIRDEITIGRKEGNTIRLTERNVSRRHARILRNNGEVHIEDLGSYNGIRVNNARIAERVSLRVSDQVQIGDYKLYLKAEGLDQVDESRTVPHERVEGAAGPTDPMVVATPNGTGPQLIPVPITPPMVGSPNRTMVAIADTDPGRAVGPATAAAVAALNAPGGYGRLVVLSSNFAGKEFELSRPQMIIGRTEENDIVINHRSISRNHAKLVREPENGRYTISDLQSSNGVRVNGSDYGKVELRRGDVIDLGHVRLRFVEAGEDFVFSRDAVITDVPEAGGRRGLLIGVLAAIVVVVAGVVVYTMHAPGSAGGGGEKHAAPVTAPSGAVTPDAGDDNVAAGSGDTTGSAAGSANAVAVADGSAAGSAEETAQPAAVTPPAPGSGGAKGDTKAKAAQCADLEVRKDWQQLLDCATELGNLGARDKAKEFHDKASKEVVNSLSEGKVRAALRDGNLREAQKLLKTIGPESVYWANLNDQFKSVENPAIEETRRKAIGMASAHECVGLKRFQAQLASSSSTNVAAAANVKCIDKNATASGEPSTGVKPAGGSGSDGGAGTSQAAPKGGACDTVNVDDAMDQAAKQFSAGFAKAALQVVNKALQCRQDVRMYRMAAMYACAAHDLPTAKAYFVRVPGSLQSGIEQKCQQEGLNIRAP